MYVQKGNMPFVICVASLDSETRWPFSKKCSTRTVECGHESVKKDVEAPREKSGLCRSGIMGSRIEQIFCLRQVSRKEGNVGWISG